jgi:hypothetical protein
MVFFRTKAIAPDVQVASVVFELKDLCIDMWVQANAAHLEALTFTAFMKELHEQFLEVNWDRDLRLKIIGSVQGLVPFNDWIINIQNFNTLLIGHTHFVTETVLRDHILANMHSSLADQCDETDVHDMVDFHAWTVAITKLDKGIIHERANTAQAAEEVVTRDCIRHGTTRERGDITRFPRLEVTGVL